MTIQGLLSAELRDALRVRKGVAVVNLTLILLHSPGVSEKTNTIRIIKPADLRTEILKPETS